jgi:dihydrodipicolinate synthase/N-acetylneuraminate lyase
MGNSDSPAALHAHLIAGQVIPAHPLALTPNRTLDERHQRALTRYYVDAGAGGIAVGVHTTQFAIRHPRHGLYRPVLELAADTARSWQGKSVQSFALVAGVIGETRQAVGEAELAASLGYHVALLGLGALPAATEDELIAHCRAVADVMPLFGFYLQPAVGGRVLSYGFWRRFAEIENAWAIKNRAIQPLSDARRGARRRRRGTRRSGTLHRQRRQHHRRPAHAISAGGGTRRIVGGLLGQWAVWTRTAVHLLEGAHAMTTDALGAEWLRENAALTDANGAIFDAAHGFAGCIPGIHEILRRQGLMEGIWCLDPAESLSTGQRRRSIEFAVCTRS